MHFCTWTLLSVVLSEIIASVEMPKTAVTDSG